ncbi:MAG: type II toxin-antitoxin system HipA family toxin [Gemmatimonadaceae bacterium]|nr:type II toxin-antitoxin system HipA family toxin [Chitinophagaceae bacterium]
MDILVYGDWLELGGATLLGTLSVSHVRGREIFSFAYDKAWLARGLAQSLDPDLQLFAGTQYLSTEKKNFGIFLDSSPDRWGRVLMIRREAISARIESRKVKTLFEEDFLLGVFDAHRMGAIRFKQDLNGPFLHDNANLASPPWTSLRELEYASLQLEKEALTDEDSLKWLNMLMAPGASLGGARPKASVVDSKNNLWIAKFPSGNDRTDIGGWEMVVNVLAKEAGLNIAEAQVKKFNSKHHSFLSKRFDRIKGKGRIHFASAMTLLGYSDGAEGASYLNLAEFIMQYGANVKEDLEELWRRIVFNISVKNTDDHLRNHGFLLTPQGWTLSPAFDVNPVYHGRGLTLNISETDNSLDFELAGSVAKYFRVSGSKAATITSRIRQAAGKWQKVAKAYKIAASEQDLMAQAFEMSGS